MKLTETPLKDCYLIEPKVIGDHRGYFMESFNKAKFYKQTGIELNVIQENQSKSKKNVLRGLHFQSGDKAQAKIVRVLQGEVLDVAVDIRKSSPSFGRHFSVMLSEENKKQLYVPRGFAHGFLILSETAEFFYCVDNHYSPAHERGIKFNDSAFNIDWKVDPNNLILSERDKNWPDFNPNLPDFE
ncbi:MAG: dTDP-4-dehydrorhamnose 3,5-epimerase [Cyclobacteriaceae bacterium]